MCLKLVTRYEALKDTIGTGYVRYSNANNAFNLMNFCFRELGSSSYE